MSIFKRNKNKTAEALTLEGITSNMQAQIEDLGKLQAQDAEVIQTEEEVIATRQAEVNRLKASNEQAANYAHNISQLFSSKLDLSGKEED